MRRSPLASKGCGDRWLLRGQDAESENSEETYFL